MSRKEVLREFKATKIPMGIVQITNRENGRVYIAKAQNPQGILNSVKFQLSIDKFLNIELQRDFNRLGWEGFDFEVVQTLEEKEGANPPNLEDLTALEDIVVAEAIVSGKKGYNFPRTSQRS